MTECVICPRPVDGTAYACTGCAGRAREHLAEVADLAPDAQDAADGLARYALPQVGGGASRTPSDLTASAVFARAAAVVIGCARDVAEIRGLEMPTPDRRLVLGPGCPAGWCRHPSCRAIRTQAAEHPVTVAALWLVGHLGWLRHRPQAAEAFADLGQAARDIARISDRPPELVIVGVCECGEWVYGRKGAGVAKCRGCDTAYDIERSRDTLRRHMDEKLLTAAQIATLAARAGHNRLKVRNLVTVWGKRGVIRAYAGDDGPTYRLGDVMARLTAAPLVEAG